jgi:hypothetical protein
MRLLLTIARCIAREVATFWDWRDAGDPPRGNFK